MPSPGSPCTSLISPSWGLSFVPLCIFSTYIRRFHKLPTFNFCFYFSHSCSCVYSKGDGIKCQCLSMSPRSNTSNLTLKLAYKDFSSWPSSSGITSWHTQQAKENLFLKRTPFHLPFLAAVAATLFLFLGLETLKSSLNFPFASTSESSLSLHQYTSLFTVSLFPPLPCQSHTQSLHHHHLHTSLLLTITHPAK